MAEEYALVARKSIDTCKSEDCLLGRQNKYGSEKRGLFRKITFQIGPNLNRMSKRFRKISCVSKADDEEIPEVPRHKSIDISVGLARRVSLFIFTRRSVCMHPYHPYTPKQTTRRIFLRNDEKQKN